MVAIAVQAACRRRPTAVQEGTHTHNFCPATHLTTCADRRAGRGATARLVSGGFGLVPWAGNLVWGRAGRAGTGAVTH